jgi:hypothetical protein
MRKVYLLLLSTALFLGACSDETTVFIDPQQDIRIETNTQLLQNSVVYSHAGVLDIAENDNISGKSNKANGEELAGDYPLTLVAQVNPPANLTASHVDVDGAYAYVSYNLAGDDYYGGIDVIDIGDPNQPRVTGRLIYSNADINSVHYSDGYLYAVGGVDAELSVRATSNSFVVKIPVVNGSFNNIGELLYGFQPGDNATDVHVDKNEVYVTSGKEGSITIYDTKDLEVKKEELFPDLRSLAFNKDKIALLDASTGIRIIDDKLKTKKEIPVSSDFGMYTKRTIDFDGEKIVIAEGNKGAGVYSYSTGALQQHIPILIDPNKEPIGDIVSNAVAINKDVILMANGGAGLCLSEDKGTTAEAYGVIQLDGSINYVQTRDDYVFAASGQNGLQIIKLNRLSQSLAAECATLSTYNGPSKLVINEGEEYSFKGSKRFNSVQVKGSLLLCGSWTVRNNVDIKDNGLMRMNGTLVVGSNNKRKKIKIEKGAVLQIEGNLTIYGDLELKDDSTIEFIGSDSVVNIFGKVEKGDNVSVAGDFEDVQNKF